MKLRAIPMILVGLVLILGSTLITEFLPDWRWTHYPFHAVIEGLGAFIAIVVAMMILSLLHYDRLSPTYVWVASALAGMGILDAFHAGTHAGQEFVWLHSIATLIGGVIFALVWIPDRITESLRAKTLPLFIGAAAMVFGLFSVTFPDALPVMTTEAGFTLAARFANILGGLCFLVASSFFFFRKRGQITNENIILSNHCFLFGISGIIFEFSVLWDGSWWLWHSLRLIAYLVVLYYFLYLFNLTQATISRGTKALKESEARFRSLADNLPGAVFQRKLTPEGRHAYTYISPRVRDLYGLEPQDIVADASVLLDAMPVEDRDRWMAASKHSASTLSLIDLQVRVIAADGATRWIRTISRPTRDENGEVVWNGVDIDITERMQAEEAVRAQGESMRLLHKIAVAANEALVVDEAMQVCLDEVCAYTGWPVGHVCVPADDGTGELAPTKLWHLDYPERFATFRRVTEATRFAPGVGLPGRVLVSSEPAWIVDVTKDPNFPRAKLAKGLGIKAGFAFPVLVGKDVAAVLEFFSEIAAEPDEHILEVMAQLGTQLGRIVERKRAEDILRESEERFRSLATNLPGTVFQRRLTSEGRLVFAYVSSGARELYGVEPEDMLADPSVFLDILPAEDRDRYLAALQHSARTLSPMDLELRVVPAGSGATRWMRTISRPSRGESGEVVWGGVAIDITEQKQVEAQLIQASKLSALGVLAANLAHELNQPLNNIRMAADSCLILIEEGDADPDYQEEQLAVISGQTQRMADIIDHVLIFSRKDEAESELFNPAATVRNAVRLVKDEMRLDGVRISAKLPRSCRPVLGHRVQLEQVMVNLFTNAKDAILARPVPARDGSRRKQRGRITVNLVDDTARDRVLITVSDTGGGIPKDVIDHLFEPFVTTKEGGKGTGLGLSVAYGIVTDMDGRIEARNTAVGAEFLITLPVAGDGRSKTKKRSVRPEKIKS